jgi:hypothetical protein
MRRLLVAALVLALAAGAAWGAAALWSQLTAAPIPLVDERCEARVGGHTTTLSVGQAELASLIAGVSVQRGLAPRAASIALTTAYQESGIRNLDYGHADSLGLFQQRPSQGWGTEEEILDPWYSTTKFYKELVKVADWETGDLNDVAQAVQRSGYPEAYRKHVANARALASALTGQTPASFSCALRDVGAAAPGELAEFLDKTYGKAASVKAEVGGLSATAKTARAAWSVAEAAVANAKRYGVRGVVIGGAKWTQDAWSLPEWAGDSQDAKTVQVLFA